MMSGTPCGLRPAGLGLPSSHLEQLATEGQKRVGWEMTVRIEKIICTVLQEAHRQQVEATMETLSEGPGRFYG